jgi:uncharacterized RDD family membrane protein YckC/Tfp pilus assembly major pilin PilA
MAMSTPGAAYTPPVDRPPAATSPQSPYGGFWVRLAAHFVDGLIIWIISFVLVLVVFLLAPQASGEIANNLAAVVLVIGGQLYHAYFVSSASMATPGKRLCGLYVTDIEGHRLGFGHALGRNLAAFFSYLTLYIGFIMAGFTERKQALHDKLAGTLVHRQPGGSAGVVVAIVVGAFFLVFVIGIIAAVAIPSYQDYSVRARLSGVYRMLESNKAAMTAYSQKNNAWPTTWEQVESAGGSNPAQHLTDLTRPYVEDFRLEANGAMVAVLKVQGKTGQLRLTPQVTGNLVDWVCSASAEINRLVPPDCRSK